MPDRTLAPSLDHGFAWLNADRPLDFRRELQGHVVLLDFWTYCCINCMHVLPDLAYLEDKYQDEPFVVIGVHSNKFTNEGTRQNVRSAILRYDIAHPVVVDEDMRIWRSFGVNSWPTRVLIDPKGYVVGVGPGEGLRREFEDAIATLLTEHRAAGTLATAPLRPAREAVVPTASRLRFPGKVLADPAGGRLFISDSNHHRIVVATWPDAYGDCDLIKVVGMGTTGFTDGPAPDAAFDHPQGMALDGDALYVADTENHALRCVDLTDWSVATVAGTGALSNDRQGGRPGLEQGLNSPWALAARDGLLYVAMAGTHQLWVHHMQSGATGVLAGSGREDIIDGPALQAALAQPSGLTLLDDVLYFADSETSAVRGLDLRTRIVFTVLGTGLFDFGNVDGAHPTAKLQHALGIAAWGDKLLVADTYNHALRAVEPTTQTITTVAGLGRPAAHGAQGELGLYEPGGVSVAGDVAFIADTNHHRMVRLDLATGAWVEVHVAGLDRPPQGETGAVIAAPAVVIAPDASVQLSVMPALPESAHINPDAPVSVCVTGEDGTALVNELRATDILPIEITIARPTAGAWAVELHLAYCTDGNRATCVPQSTQWTVPVAFGAAGVACLELRGES